MKNQYFLKDFSVRPSSANVKLNFISSSKKSIRNQDLNFSQLIGKKSPVQSFNRSTIEQEPEELKNEIHKYKVKNNDIQDQNQKLKIKVQQLEKLSKFQEKALSNNRNINMEFNKNENQNLIRSLKKQVIQYRDLHEQKIQDIDKMKLQVKYSKSLEQIDQLIEETKRLRQIVDNQEVQLQTSQLNLRNYQQTEKNFFQQQQQVQNMNQKLQNLEKQNMKLINDNTKLKDDYEKQQKIIKKFKLENEKQKKEITFIKSPKMSKQIRLNNSDQNSIILEQDRKIKHLEQQLIVFQENQKNNYQKVEELDSEIYQENIQIIFEKIRFKLMSKRISLKYIELFLFDDDQNNNFSDQNTLYNAMINEPFQLNQQDALKLSQFLIKDEFISIEQIIQTIQDGIQPFQILNDLQEKKIENQLFMIFNNNNNINLKDNEKILNHQELQKLNLNEIQQDILMMNLYSQTQFQDPIQYKHLKEYIYKLQIDQQKDDNIKTQRGLYVGEIQEKSYEDYDDDF